jgi:hypothetical protein
LHIPGRKLQFLFSSVCLFQVPIQEPLTQQTNGKNATYFISWEPRLIKGFTDQRILPTAKSNAASR